MTMSKSAGRGTADFGSGECCNCACCLFVAGQERRRWRSVKMRLLAAAGSTSLRKNAIILRDDKDKSICMADDQEPAESLYRRRCL